MIISDIGEGLTIVAFSTSRSSDYGDETITGSAVYAVTAGFVPMTADAQEVKSGILEIGDARGYFAPGDLTKLVPGYIIERRNLQYEITSEPQIFGFGGAVDHIEVNLKRHHKP